MTAARVPALPWLVSLGLIAMPPYLLILRFASPATWRSLRSALERILPGHQRLSGAKRRLAAADGRSSA
jgi:hypothetical protein